jgi:hypothetical protein
MNSLTVHNSPRYSEQTVQFTVKALTVHSESIHRAVTVQNNVIHIEFTHSAQ